MLAASAGDAAAAISLPESLASLIERPVQHECPQIRPATAGNGSGESGEGPSPPLLVLKAQGDVPAGALVRCWRRRKPILCR